MAGHARKDIVREGEIGTYHTWSRCVQGLFLCGYDPVTGKDFDYRRSWIKSLLQYQASVFAVDVGNYNILSNHQHLIARTRPDIAATWSDEEVAWRWKRAWPKWMDGEWVREPTDQEIEELLAWPNHIPWLRANLASLSWFMARWKEPIAKLCNAESKTKGHYYAERYGSRELVDDPGTFCAFGYVDLNQKKAGMIATLEDSRYSAIQDRLLAWKQQEARDSLEDFRGRNPKGYDMTQADIDTLFADCFLSPIDDKGPLLLVDACGAYRPLQSKEPQAVIIINSPDSRDVSVDDESDQAKPDTHPPTESTENAATTTKQNQKADNPTRPKSKTKPTWKKHRRLKRRCRPRASDNPILGMPREQYLEIVQLTAERLDSPQSELPNRLQASLRQWGVDPTRWMDIVEHFGNWFHRAVGRAEKLTRTVERSGKKWIQGIRACRDVFT